MIRALQSHPAFDASYCKLVAEFLGISQSGMSAFDLAREGNHEDAADLLMSL